MANPYAESRGKGDFPWRVRWPLPLDETGEVKWDSASGFSTREAALAHGWAQVTDISRGVWVDEKKGAITLSAWWERWIEAQDVDVGTVEFYTSLWRNHLGPRWGATALRDLKRTIFTAWLTGLGNGTVETGPAERRTMRKYAPRTTNGLRKMLSLMLEDAAEEKLIGRNPLALEGRARTRGRRAARRVPAARPKLGITPAEVMMVAVNMYGICGPVGFVRTVTAAWTGARPGEQAALKRQRCHPAAARPLIRIDDDEGTTQEYGGKIVLAPPKGGLGRDVLLPRSLALLLADWLRIHPADVTVIKGPHEEHWRRRQWNERWRPGCDGKAVLRRVGRQFEPTGEWAIEPVVPGLEFKGLRRAHNVWLTEDGVPEVARAHRLGHAMSDDMQAAYSLVSAAMERELLAGLERRWQEALTPEAWEIISQISPKLASEHPKGLT
jgi:hypothetical protein